jgi:CRP-like cAMP-binding protein
MAALIESLQGLPVRHFGPDESVMVQGGDDGVLFVLIEGAVEVVKDGVKVAACSDPGAVFGEMSVLLRLPHTATVRTLRPSSFAVVDDPRAFLGRNPAICLHVCELLARRLDAVNKYLVDVKRQFAGHDHLGMVDEVLDTLVHRQPRKRVPPRDATLRDPEIAD